MRRDVLRDSKPDFRCHCCGHRARDLERASEHNIFTVICSCRITLSTKCSRITLSTNRATKRSVRLDYKRFPSNRPIDFRPHKAASPVRSTAGRIPRRCANREFDWHPPVSTGGPVRESPYDKASRAGPTGTPQCRAGFPGTSVEQCHRSVLFGARQCLNREVATITRDQPHECAPREARDGIQVNGSLFHRAPRFTQWREVTGIDVQCPAEFNQNIVFHVAGGGDVQFGTIEFHRTIAKTLKILWEWRPIANPVMG
jgi:hypothetical protein